VIVIEGDDDPDFAMRPDEKDFSVRNYLEPKTGPPSSCTATSSLYDSETSSVEDR
jgi:hypothetical protein